MGEHCTGGCDHEQEGCSCGCGEQEESGIITLMDEEGVEHGFEILDMVELEGSQYLALIPVDEDEEDEDDELGQLVILKVVANGVEEYLEAIEDEAEFERVSAVFVERLGEDFDFVEGDE